MESKGPCEKLKKVCGRPKAEFDQINYELEINQDELSSSNW